MNSNVKPHFIVKNKFQKGGSYSDILTDDILRDLCKRVTERTDYTCTFDDEGYNKGRLVILEYSGVKNYISLAQDGKISGRNYFFQSVTTTLVQYYQDLNPHKRLYYYFLPFKGEIETNYFKFMYRLMLTAGFEFLNANNFLKQEIEPFKTIQDVMNQRDINRGRNRSNNSTYITKSSDNIIDVYGKTYGANKKETALLCIALSHITSTEINLYQICEQNLVVLPEPDLGVIASLGNINVTTADLTMERRLFEEENSLRSPTYIYNLFEKLGDKKCAFCGCEIPELVEGAHVWPVADIKKNRALDFERKLKFATDGENGLWLCVNHHKMFDMNLLRICDDRRLKFKSNLEERTKNFIRIVTPITQIESRIFTDRFFDYLRKRNSLIGGVQYSLFN